MTEGRLIVVSNRGPFKFSHTKRGLKRIKSIGGLVTSILPMMKQNGGVWIAWGEPAGRFPGASGRSDFIIRYLKLTREQELGFYWGLSNTALWPLCHSFLGRVRYDAAEWKTYEAVNRLFAQATLEEMNNGDLVWIHDYQLALVQRYLRAERPDSRLAFFWHIPFPGTEIYRTFPWRSELMKSLLKCNLIGFHVPEYKKNFSEAAAELLGAEVEGEWIRYAGHRTRVLARPIGIDYRGVERLAHQERIQKRVRELKEHLPGQTILLGVERMDYTKGILERLRAVENLLDRNPQYRGSVTLIQIVTPSREIVKAYQQKKREIDETVGRINGRFSNEMWIPIRYLFRSFSLEDLVAYYCLSDIALITPLRDGLNLVAKEFIASRLRGDGALILSEFAGVSWQLPEAILVNPYSEEEMAAAIDCAIQTPESELHRRMQRMQDRIRTQDISWWTGEFLRAMRQLPPDEPPAWPERVLSAIRNGNRTWIFLDFDGTLVPIARSPQEAHPDAGLISLLSRLVEKDTLRLVVLSGRPLSSLQQMLPVDGLTLAGTYGVEVQLPDGRRILRSNPDSLRPTVEDIKREWTALAGDRKGFLIEDKGMAVALHARFAGPEDAQSVLEGARTKAAAMIRGKGLRLLGGDRFLEAAPANANKRWAVDWMLDQFGGPDPLTVYFGDDDKDEDAFSTILHRGGLPIVVGSRQPDTRASIRLHSPQNVREWLAALLPGVGKTSP
jgi:trehalose 6-phosphate synthase/phosphatase